MKKQVAGIVNIGCLVESTTDEQTKAKDDILSAIRIKHLCGCKEE